jgi:hypothetical protein
MANTKTNPTSCQRTIYYVTVHSVVIKTHYRKQVLSPWWKRDFPRESGLYPKGVSFWLCFIGIFPYHNGRGKEVFWGGGQKLRVFEVGCF